ncbi:ABC transporter ATP-binding protein [Bradyrhizobium sp. C9]|uniref:ABC transporter ATP-binding protein n=1 Tax=Bradyrhizobium sp. C9 TaxID=142585 RepID=UPI0018E91AF4|nr:ABC transporter ATP-binding protein [Bradyrhizobium sp. C9]
MKPSASAEGEHTAVYFDTVTKRFDDVAALNAVTLGVGRSEFVTLLGPSGCGKTTLLKLAAGFLGPDGGSISIEGKRVNDIPTYRRGIGMMFQNYALFPHMSVADNVAYGLKTRRVPKADRDKRVADALALVKLKGMENRKPRQLSGGQQQRVALARALVINPTVLLLDEPFSALDKSLRTSMQVELREIQRRLGLTTIFVTHDQGEALSMSDRVAVMSEGRIRQLGSPVDVYRSPADPFVASFVGDNNRLRGQFVSMQAKQAIVALGDALVRVPGESLSGLEKSAAVDLFVRPEQFDVVAPEEPCTIKGSVVAQIYQGGHVDLQIECSGGAGERLLVRSPGEQAVLRWPMGAPVGVAIQADQCSAFPAA